MVQALADELHSEMAGRLLIAGEWIAGAARIEVADRFDLRPFAYVHVPDTAQIDVALNASKRAVGSVRTTNYERFEILAKAARLVGANEEGFVPVPRAERQPGLQLAESGLGSVFGRWSGMIRDALAA